MKITSERLSITDLSVEDHGLILELLNSPGWIQFIGDRNVKTEQNAKDYIEAIINNSKVEYWTVRLTNNQLPIGIVTFIKKEYLLHHDIGFAFLPEYGNRGYAGEATAAVLHSLAIEGEFSVILAVTVPENLRSVALLKKIGFSYARTIEQNDEKLHVYETTADSILAHSSAL